MAERPLGRLANDETYWKGSGIGPFSVSSLGSIVTENSCSIAGLLGAGIGSRIVIYWCSRFARLDAGESNSMKDSGHV